MPNSKSIQNTFPIYTSDLSEDLMLATGSAVRHILEDIGMPEEERDTYGSLLYDHDGEDYTQVYGAETAVPKDSTHWYDLLLDNPEFQPSLFDYHKEAIDQ